MTVQKNYGLVSTIAELQKFVDKLIREGKPFGFDIETGYLGEPKVKKALHPEENLICGFSFTNSTDWARYCPINHHLHENVDSAEAARALWPLMQTGLGVAHNLSFEERNMSRWFLEHVPEAEPTQGYFPARSDSMIEAYLMGCYQSVALKALTMQLFNHDQPTFASLFPDLKGKKLKLANFATLDLSPKVVGYACEDAVWCLALHERHYPEVKDMLLYRIEMEVLKIVCRMEDYGLGYDWAMMAKSRSELEQFIVLQNQEIQAHLSKAVGRAVNISLASPKQVSDMLFGELGMVTTRFTKSVDKKTGAKKMSTDAIALTSLAKEHPVVRKILDYKEQKTLLTRYLAKYDKEYNYAPDGRTHPNHMQTGAGTGRFAVSDPAYQQCCLGDVEVLTPQGWQRLDALAAIAGNGGAVEVAQFVGGAAKSPDACRVADDGIEFVVGEMVALPYTGPVVRVRGAEELGGTTAGRKGEGGTWYYTPNHRMVFRRRQPRGGGLGPIDIVTAEEWMKSLNSKTEKPEFGKTLDGRRIPRGGHRAGGIRLDETERQELRLAIACQADGEYIRGRGPRYRIEVCRPRKVEALRALTPVHRSHTREGNYFEFYVPRGAVERWLDESKNFRFDTILALCEDDLRFFVSEIMQWDGDSTRECAYGQKVTRRQSVNVVQAAAALCGMSTTIHERPKYDAVSVNVTDRQYREAGWQSVDVVPCPGDHVYCVTVPSGMLLVRNTEGVVQVTGNSPKKYHYKLDSGKEYNLPFRDMIRAAPEHYLLGFDYSQIELRVLAGESQEPTLLNAFDSDEDVHSATASLMLGIPLDEITSDQRSIGKTLNFSLLYGQGVKSLAERMAKTYDEAKHLHELYFASFTSIRVWMDRAIAMGKKNGYTMSRLGRKNTVWELRSEDPYIKSKGDRICVNSPIQGGAADYMKVAMVRADTALRQAGLLDDVHMIMNIHDALIFEIARTVDPARVIAVLQPAVTFPMDGYPKIVADWELGIRWGSMRKIVLEGTGADLKVTVRAGKPKEEDSIEEESLPADESEEDGELEDVEDSVEGEVDVQQPGLKSLSVTVSHAISDTPLMNIASSGPPSQPVQKIATLPTLPAQPGKRLVIGLERMPDSNQWQRFRDFLAQHPGNNTLLLRTPEGEKDFGSTILTSVSDQDASYISIVFGGATAAFEISADEMADVFAELVL